MIKEQLNRHPAWAGERTEVRRSIERSHPRQCIDRYCSATFALGLSESCGSTMSKHIRRVMKEPQTKH